MMMVRKRHHQHREETKQQQKQKQEEKQWSISEEGAVDEEEDDSSHHHHHETATGPIIILTSDNNNNNNNNNNMKVSPGGKRKKNRYSCGILSLDATSPRNRSVLLVLSSFLGFLFLIGLVYGFFGTPTPSAAVDDVVSNRNKNPISSDDYDEQDKDNGDGDGGVVVNESRNIEAKTKTIPIDIDYSEFEEKCPDESTSSYQDAAKKEKADQQIEAAKLRRFWTPSYPSSINDNVMKSLVTAITGIQMGGAMSYYAQARNRFKKCKMSNGTPTALCLVVHPMVFMNPGPDASKFIASDFQNRFIYLIRNPRTAMPSHHNGKAIKYHHQVGQVDVQEWRKFRDKFVRPRDDNDPDEDGGGMMSGWKDQLLAWERDTTLTAAMYLSRERLYHPVRGPKILLELSRLLRSAGFDSLLDDDDDEDDGREDGGDKDGGGENVVVSDRIKCLWYRALGGRTGIEKEAGYEYGDYIPGYTKEQRDYMLDELSNFTEYFGGRPESPSRDELLSILREYYDDIRDNTPLDVPYREGGGGEQQQRN